MKIIITGSNGFVGQNLLKAVRKNHPDWHINCLVRSSKTSSDTSINYSAVDYLDIKSFDKCEAFADVDYVFHAAGVTKSASEKGFIEGNVLPTKHLLETLKQRNIKLKRFVLISSQSANGPSDSLNHLKTEDEPEEPIEPYGKSKLEAEKLVKSYAGIFPYTIVSPSSVYGPADVDFYNIFKMTKMGLNVYAGNKDKYISIIYVEDLVNAILTAAQSDRAINQKYFVNMDEPVSWKQVQEEIFKSAGKNKLDLSIPYPVIYYLGKLGSIYSFVFKKNVLLNSNKALMAKPSYWICSNQKAKRDFNFSTKYSLAEGVKLTYNWYKVNGWL